MNERAAHVHDSLNLCVANPILQTYVANGGGGEKDPSDISAAIQDRDKISTATPPVF